MDWRRCESSGRIEDGAELCAKADVAHAIVTAASSKILAILTELPFVPWYHGREFTATPAVAETWQQFDGVPMNAFCIQVRIANYLCARTRPFGARLSTNAFPRRFCCTARRPSIAFVARLRFRHPPSIVPGPARRQLRRLQQRLHHHAILFGFLAQSQQLLRRRRGSGYIEVHANLLEPHRHVF
jgi:hypothetical protein